MSSPTDDERILEAAERIAGRHESEQEATLAALAPSDRQEVALVMERQAAMVVALWDVLVAGLPREEWTRRASDPLDNAERQMAERFTEAAKTLSWRVIRAGRRVRAEAENEIAAAIEQMLAEHPELRDQAETVATFLLAYGG